MEKRVIGLSSAVFLFWFGLSGCQSCNCGKQAADEQAGAGPQEEATRQPRPEPENQRVSLENYSGPAEGGIESRPKKPDARAVDLSGMPLVEPVELDKKSKAPPATMRRTGVMKRLQEEQQRRKGSKPQEPAATVPPADDHQPGPKVRGKGKLVKGRPKGARNSRPQKKPRRGHKAGTPR